MALFKGGNGEEDRIEELEKEVAKLQQLLDPSVRDAIVAQNTVDELEEQAAALRDEVEKLQERADALDFKILKQETGIYEPRYNMEDDAELAKLMRNCREKQAKAAREYDRKAARAKMRSGMNKQETSRLVQGTARLVLRCFNMECDDIVRSVTPDNVRESMDRIIAASDAIDYLGETLGVKLPLYYLDYKIEEVQLACEYVRRRAGGAAGDGGEVGGVGDAGDGRVGDAGDGGEVGGGDSAASC